MKSTCLGILMSATLAGCVAPPQVRPPHHITSSFDEGMARKLIEDGVNTIKGNSFMRQRGGGVVTCAGLSVNLVPATNYAKERISVLYGSSEGGVSRHNYTFEPDPPAYRELVKKTTCDSQGNFQFDKVADGEFYVNTTVAWQAGNKLQGGNMIKLVIVRNGQTVSIVISG